MVTSTITIGASLPVYYLLAKAYGAKGIAMATSISMALLFVVLYRQWQIRMKPSEKSVLFKNLMSATLTAAIGGGIAFGISRFLSSQVAHLPHFSADLIVVCCAGIPASVVSAILCDRFGLISLKSALAAIVRKIKRRKA
jgi:peptidoglycan biosynthesis protein MviN/MurJ (putative lipid II flippase)